MRAEPHFRGGASLPTGRLLPVEFGPAPISPTVLRTWAVGISQVLAAVSFPRVGVVVGAFEAMGNERRFGIIEGVQPLIQAAA